MAQGQWDRLSKEHPPPRRPGVTKDSGEDVLTRGSSVPVPSDRGRRAGKR